MTEIGEWLMVNYYSKYIGTRTDIVPNEEMIDKALTQHQDKIVIIKDDKIRGVAIFVSLSDNTFNLLKSFDITQFDVLQGLLQEHGPNLHFVLLCADGTKTIMRGLHHIEKTRNPKTISWWNPDLTKLHVRRY